jgi:hypothetical protein
MAEMCCPYKTGPSNHMEGIKLYGVANAHIFHGNNKSCFYILTYEKIIASVQFS